MAIPEGYIECIEQCEENEALKLEKAIYGLVQVARQFFKKKFMIHYYRQTSKQVKLIHAQYIKEDQEIGVCIMLIYINDMLIVGKTKAIKDVIQVLQQSFEVKKPATLEDYLGVQVIKSKNDK